MRTSFVQAVDNLVKEATWLTPADDVLIVGLYAAAEQLDNGDPQAALLGQYRNFIAMIHKSRPKQAAEVDPVQALLDGAREESGL